MQNNSIGFFDSGVGGLTVLAELRKLLPCENFIFFGDTKNMPYGDKTKEQLLEFSRNAFEFFEKQNVKAVVMACNTTSAVVYEELKDKYNFILYPLIQSVAKIFSELNVNKFGVFATQATINSHAYSKQIKKYNNAIEVVEIACPEWVNLVENKLTETTEAQQLVEKYLKKMLSYNPNKIILGCTHYPYLINILSKYAPKEIFINPAQTYAKYILGDLRNQGLLNNSERTGSDKFYVSENPEKFIQAAKMFYNVHSCELFY